MALHKVKAEQNRALHAEFQQAVTDGLEDIVLLSDAQYELLYTTPAFKRLGYDPERLSGRLLDYVYPDDQERLENTLSEAAAAGIPYRLTLRFRTADGVYTEAELSGKPREGTLRFVSTLRLLDEETRNLAHLAYHDALTGLANRHLFERLAQQALAQAAREQQGLALIYLDVNGFKAVNDRYGHETGDEVLVAIARRLEAAARDADVLARIGDDEFVYLLSHTDAAGAATAAERLLRAFASPFSHDGVAHSLGASLGIALYPQHGDDLATLLRHADQAMYRAKASGGGIYPALEPASELLEPAELERLMVRYLPLLELSSGQSVGLSVRYSLDGQPLPADLRRISRSDTAGELLRLRDYRTLEETLNSRAHHPQPLSLYLSADTLMHTRFVSYLKGLLEASTLSADKLTLNFSLATLQQQKDVLEVLQALKELGVTLGVYGLQDLKDLPPFPLSRLMLEGDSLPLSLNPAEIERLEALIEQAQALGLTVVAEEVTAAQRTWLRALGCDLVTLEGAS